MLTDRPRKLAWPYPFRMSFMNRPRVSLPSHPASGEDSPQPLSDGTGVGAPRPDALPPGSRLDEYRIERVIGASGFGIVYLAQDTALDRPVAIKEYLPDTLAMRGEDGLQVMLRAPSHAESFERGRRAFIEEAQLLAQCDHPSLLRVLRKWEGNGTVYRAMPCYRGQTLLSLRQSMQGPPDEASLRALLDGLMEALETLHAVGGVHREVSPANILLLPDDRPVLMDWSAARRAIVGNQARALMTLLAPSFAPIEQVMPSPERPVGPWTDVYALGMVVKYCLSGELPPPASLMSAPTHAPMAMLVRQLREKHPSLHYSPSFLAAIDGALIHLPEDRLRSIEELRQRLDDHPSARGDFLDLDLDAASAQAANDTGSMSLGEPQEPTFARAAETADHRPEDAPAGATASAAAPADAPPPEARRTNAGADRKPASGFGDTPRTAPGTNELWNGLFGARAAQADADRIDEDHRFLAPELASEPPDIDLSQPGELPPLPAFDARTEPDISLDDRPMSLPGFGERSRRARRRAAWFAAILLLGSAGAAAWWMNQEREAAQAQSAFEMAATRDGLTAQLPALPAPPATDAASPPAAPVNAAPGTSGSEADIVPAQPPRPGVAATTTPATQDVPPQLAAATPPPVATVDAPASPRPDVPAAAMPPAPEPSVIAPATPLTSTSGTGAAAEPARPQRPAATAARNERQARTPPPKSGPAPRPAETARIANPREACGNRTEFSLYRCMQAQCAKAQWKQHPSCKRLRSRDEVE